MDNTIPLVPIIGTSLIRMPYDSQSDTFKNKKNNVSDDKSLVDFVFHILITCGKNVIVETKPAAVPIKPIKVSGIINFKQLLIFFFRQFADATWHSTAPFLPAVFHVCRFLQLLPVPAHKSCRHA